MSRAPRPPSTDVVVVTRPTRTAVTLDVGVEVVSGLTRRLLAVTRTGRHLGAPLAAVVLRPSMVAREHWPQTYLLSMAGRGRTIRERAEQRGKAQLSVIIPVVVEAVLNRIDLTRLVISRVDIDAIAATVDLDAIVERLDLLGIAHDIIDGIDLPEIIRESSSAMASEARVGARMRGIEADERVSRIVDRVMLRRRGGDAAIVEHWTDPNGDD